MKIIDLSVMMANNRDTDTATMQRINVNITGKKYEILKTTLQKFPNTRLAKLDETQENYDGEKDEYYFERDPTVFESVINYYRTGELHVPLSLCGPVVKTELEYWGISDRNIERCCWPHYSQFQTQKTSLLKYEKSTVYQVNSTNVPYTRFGRWRHAAWIFLENPQSSRYAVAYSLFSLGVIIISIMILIISTMPQLQEKMTKNDWAIYHGVSVDDILEDDPDYWDDEDSHRNRSYPRFFTDKYPPDPMNRTTARKPRKFHIDKKLRRAPEVFETMNIACAIFFTLELLARFLVSPRKLRFFCDGFNLIDLFCIIPMYVWWISHELKPKERYQQSYLDFINALQVIRVFRVLRMMKYSKGLWVLVYTVKVSLSEIALTFIFVGMGVLIFGSLIHYADDRKTFVDIPTGFWWAIVTMTTVGYGDKYPTTTGGYILGSLCSISGVIVIALTVPIVVNNFLLFYQHGKSLSECISRNELQTEANGGSKTNNENETLDNNHINVDRRTAWPDEKPVA
ncbi:potassium voltage-gated channel protein Shaw-like [Tubulanus polymorphus]|uniref:potassium voltage-gated channel protein Shaw-like n=1 Tax=Tubulanus polymorphus TaxID=672921 RepID=UPI003DA5C45D